MYNLIITSDCDAWTGDPVEILANRIFTEYTETDLKDRFWPATKQSISEAIKFPALLGCEKGCKRPFQVGRIESAIVRQGICRITYNIDRTIGEIPESIIDKLEWDLDLGKYELSRTHWAIKEVDLPTALLSAGISGVPKKYRPTEQGASKPISISPIVFRTNELAIQNDQVAVMMPFDPCFARVHDAIREACIVSNLKCVRADLVWNESEIIQDIFDIIRTSFAVVCDFSGRNPNVMYETGIAHTLGRPVIPITQSSEDVPFDLRHHRYAKYDLSESGLAKLKIDLATRFESLARNL